MGNCNFKTDESDPTVGLSISNFSQLAVIGKGGFGKVWEVQDRKIKTCYAMKEMAKSRVIAKRSVNSVMNERKLLMMLRHGFIVNMQFAFQDSENLYLAMDLMRGGDLRYHLGKRVRFTER